MPVGTEDPGMSKIDIVSALMETGLTGNIKHLKADMEKEKLCASYVARSR